MNEWQSYISSNRWGICNVCGQIKGANAETDTGREVKVNKHKEEAWTQKPENTKELTPWKYWNVMNSQGQRRSARGEKKVSNEVERKYKVAEGGNTQSSSDFLKISIFTANVCRLQITVSVFFDI